MSYPSVETSFTPLAARPQSGLGEIINRNPCTIDELEAETFELNYRVEFLEHMFYGDVKIHLKLKTTLSYIVLNKGSNYEVEHVAVRKGSIKLEVDNVIDYPPEDKLIIGLNRKLLPGSYIVSMLTKGYLSNEPRGFYVINKEPDKKFALTLLAPDRAKLVFPCFEHPTIKSIFIISLMRPLEGFSAMSNMKIDVKSSTESFPTQNSVEIPVQKVIIDYPTEKVATVKFLPTPPIPSYLVSMIVGTLETAPPLVSKFGYLLSMSTRRVLVDKTAEVLGISMSILSAYAKYLRRHFSLGKLDLVAVPFESEPQTSLSTPGIILLRETEVIDLNQKTSREFVLVMKRLLNEIAHQWIGGMVVLDQWNDFWLSEGLAGLLTNVVGSLMFPRWYSDWVSQVFELHPALYLNAIDSSASIQDESLPPDLDSGMHFTNIYCKSAGILRMLWSIDVDSMRYCLNEMFSINSSLNPNTLWISFNNMVLIDTNSLLKSWKNQKNYPLIMVSQTATCLPQIRQIPFGRKRFKGSDDGSLASNGYKWDVPITYFNPGKPKKCSMVWLKKENDDLIINDYRGKWVKLNWHQLGYFRVNYTRLMWSHFIELFHNSPKAFDVEDAVNLIDDAFCLANYGHLSHDIPFKLVAYFKNGFETEALPWLLTSKHLKKIYRRTFGTPVQTPLEKFFLVLLQNNVSEDLWALEDQPIIDTLRKTEILNFASWIGLEEVLKKMKLRFIDWIDSREMSVELESLVVTYGLSGGQDDCGLWEELWDSCRVETNQTKLTQLWTSLSGTKEVDRLTRLIDHASGAVNEESDFDEAFTSLTKLEILSRNHLASEMIWEKMRDDWSNTARFSSSLRKKVGNIMMNVCESIKNISTLQSIIKYGEENADADIVAFGMDAIGDEERWALEYCDYMTEWLHHYVTNNIII